MTSFLRFLVRAAAVPLAVALLLSSHTFVRAEAEAKRVIMLQSFGLRFKPWTDFAESFRSELLRQSKVPIDFQDYSLVSARFDGDKTDEPFVDYLRSLYREKSPDLIVALGAPAAAFVQRYRSRMFPQSPMLFYAVEARRVDYDKLTRNDTVAAAAHDFPLAIQTILQVLPETKVLLVINGASPNEKVWQGVLERELAPVLERGIELRWSNQLSFDELLQQAAQLPAHSAIFWHLMNVDAKGVTYEAGSALHKLASVANAPIFSYLDLFFDGSIVGGSMHSLKEGSTLAAAAAVRILNGEKAGDIKTPPTRFTAPRFDWRQLQRWNISESSLPQGSEVYFREPTAWDRYRTQIIVAVAALLLQSTMIFWLMYEHRRRHRAELMARGAMSELMQMDRIATAGELSASISHEVNQPLTSISLDAATALMWLDSRTPNLAELRDVVTHIEKESERAGAIVSNLRALFKKGDHKKEAVDINTIIHSALDIAKAELRKDEIAIHVTLGNDLLTCLGNGVQLQQVILNLVRNARDAMRTTARRELFITSERSGPDWLKISIEDTGPGIPATEREQVFRPMVTSKTDGMGMGLAICKSIAEAHNGWISLKPGTRSGALFEFLLPRLKAPSPTIGEHQEANGV